jgi:hypothetical protein
VLLISMAVGFTVDFLAIHLRAWRTRSRPS